MTVKSPLFLFLLLLFIMNIEKILSLAEALYADEPEKYEEIKLFLVDASESEIEQYARKLDLCQPYKRKVDFIDYDIIDILYD